MFRLTFKKMILHKMQGREFPMEEYFRIRKNIKNAYQNFVKMISMGD